MKCFITIDVEPDNVWADTQSKKFSNLKYLWNFNELCIQYDLKVNYFITYSVANNKNCLKILENILKRGNCEIGIHSHMWEIPPIVPNDLSNKALTGNLYQKQIVEEKLSNLINLIKKNFDYPKSHRAGRFGMSNTQLKILMENNIRVDSSIVPGINWSATGIINYLNAKNEIYEMDENDFLNSGNSGVIQVPCTVKPMYFKNSFLNTGIYKKILNKLGLKYNWLRVSPEKKIDDFKETIDWVIKSNLGFLNLMSHSSEFMVNGSPYWTSKNEIEYQFTLYKNIFTIWRDLNFKSELLSSLSKNIK
jgi:hypothetical protein